MTKPTFAHLHVHTQYSMLDGAIRLDDLLSRCKEYEMEAVAITDHGTMFGALEFYTKAKKAGIKPIVGCEFYVAPQGRLVRKRSGAGNFHLVLLAMNETGYRNLLKLASIAQLEGFYYKPRIDKEVLAEHNEGIIALTACLHGEVAWFLARGETDIARQRAEELKEIFGDRLYFELQENSIPKQTIVNDGLKKLAAEMDVKLVATNDCHYLNQDESYAHEVLLAIQTSKTISDPKRFKFSTNELYFKSSAEMADRFSHCPEAVTNTMEIVERCNLDLKFGDHHFPIFPIPEGESLETVFEKACWDGLAERFDEMRELGGFDPSEEKKYHQRLTMEIGVIRQMGFAGYFLIVSDFINWAKSQEIPVGPGRGSGAGSLAAYSMQITDLDPLEHGLIFERFLNIERQGMPDFDVDFCKDRRDEVISYVQQKYGGSEHVAQIVAYGSMKARAVIRDVGRVLEIPLHEVDRIAKLIPEELKITIDKAIDREPRLREAMKRDDLRELLSVARTLEGLARHKTIHAAGIVISPKPMVEYLPLCKGPNGEVLTQFDMKYTEKTGLIKFDFLGLKTLTVIDRALRLIKQDIGTDLDLKKISMTDAKTFDLLCKGNSLGVFQLESDGMRDLLVKMAPEQFSDLVALVALYRPGPMESGMHMTFVDTKHGRRPPEYPLPQIKPVLEETYGVIVYQEQVQKIANILAGYSLGDADILRRAMGKKIPEVMEKEREKFMAGALKNKVPEKKAKYIFDLMAKFAGYGFNKSHSAAYALISYQTAYLKAHYPAQFMAALLSCDVDNTDKVVRYINECKLRDIEVLPPDINESDHDFTVINDRVRFGLAAVKNVGGAALDSIIEERREKGPYTSLSDFCGRIDSSKVNKKVIESLIKAGAFDSLKVRRAQLMAVLGQALDQAKAVQRDRRSGQMSLFALAGPDTKSEATEIELPDIPEWPELEKLSYEKETVGFFITGHPLESCASDLKRVAEIEIIDLDKCRDGQPVRIGGLFLKYKEHKSKKGDRMAFTVVEDMTGSVEVVIFPSTFAQCSPLITSDEPVVILGSIQEGERGAKIIAETVDTLDRALEKYVQEAKVTLRADRIGRDHLQNFKELLYTFHGTCPVSLTLHFDGRGEVDIEMLKDLSVKPCREFFQKMESSFGADSLVMTMKEPEIERRAKKYSYSNNKGNA